MEYQPDRSGPGAFTRGGDNREIAARLEKLGLESNYVSQFFATSRDSKLGFVESVVLLFEDEGAAESAVGPVEREYLDFLDSSETITAPDLGEQAFGVRGEFDGYPTYAYGWLSAATYSCDRGPNGEKPGSRSTVRLAAQLVAKGDDR